MSLNTIIETCKKQEKKIWLLVFLISIILLFIRCLYGIGIDFSDEFSQPATVKRFLHGDRLLIDDWQPATTLIGYLIYSVCFWAPKSGVDIIYLRVVYVVFQVIVAMIFIRFAQFDRKAVKICALAYLFSTPYGIMSICYNTVAISAFVLFLVFLLREYTPIYRVCAGILLAISVLAIPHVVIVFIAYLMITTCLWAGHKTYEPFCIRDLMLVGAGIGIVFIPFCLILVMNGSLAEYYINLGYIFGDVEHSQYSIPVKLVRCHFQLLRVYWRSWGPLLIICMAGWMFRHKEKVKEYSYIFSCLVTIYATIRFAFIYGSISINLMVIPLFYWGVSTVFFVLVFEKNKSEFSLEIIWIVLGYLFAVCDYLATNTELLSMSSMFIVAAVGAIALNCKYVYRNSFSLRLSSCITSVVFVFCLAILRMTFIWGDAPVSELEERLEIGVAKGIYTTYENAEKYYKVQEVISRADVGEQDNVLIVPINPLYYLSCEGAVASPYVFRFKTDISELVNYYATHVYKYPTKVVIFEKSSNMDIVDYFIQNGYYFIEQNNDYCIMSK